MCYWIVAFFRIAGVPARPRTLPTGLGAHVLVDRCFFRIAGVLARLRTLPTGLGAHDANNLASVIDSHSQKLDICRPRHLWNPNG